MQECSLYDEVSQVPEEEFHPERGINEMNFPDKSEAVVAFMMKLNETDEHIHYAGQAVGGKILIKVAQELQAGSYILDVCVAGKFVMTMDMPSAVPGIKKEITFAQYRPAESSGGGGESQQLSLKCAGDASVFSETLPPGDNIIEFSIILPASLPSSLITNSWISVEYSVESKIKNSRSDEVLASFSLPVQIYDMHDLNRDPDLNKEEVVRNTVQNFGFFQCITSCIRGMPPQTVSSIPVRGFVPYEIIPVKVNMMNNNCCNILQARSIEVFLVQEVRRKGDFFKTFMVAGSKVEGEDLLDPEFTQFGYTLCVPNVPPTGNYPDLELDIQYKICVVIRLAGRRHRVRLNLPIVIGTVALLHDMGIDVPF